VKLVRLREGVYGSGESVSDGRQPVRVVHLVEVGAALDAPDGVTTYCGTHFAPGTLVEVPWATGLLHSLSVLMDIYAACLYGQDVVALRLMEQSLGHRSNG
jgi:hypothetical protein